MTGTWWALVPALVAIILALISKEVYVSLFAGVLLGAMFVARFNPWNTFDILVTTMISSIDMKIIIFDILLGMIIVLLSKSGGSAAYGRWASKHIKSKKAAQFATIWLGILIFVDDYFNCLTVGSVMRPVTDKYRMSRAKLAYIIDATAAPVCIIAPISSWAAAVNSYVPKGSSLTGFQLFLNTIPYNLYALLTLAMLFAITGMDLDFGMMKKHEDNAAKGDLFTSGGEEFKEMQKEDENANPRGRVADLVVPVAILIVSAVAAMIYTGFRGGAGNIRDAFANCDAEMSLILATGVTVVYMAFQYLPRKIVTFREFMDAFTEGAKLMMPAILILTFAWTLKGMGDQLGIADFVSGFVGSHASAGMFVPVIIYCIAIFLSFSTGTSWGTFAILIPIVISIFNGGDDQMMVIAISAVLAGSVCGDHVSPISDTTIMSSAGAQSNHINHVQTQMQYAAIPASICVAGYVVAGFTRSWIITLIISVCILLTVLAVIKRKQKAEVKIKC